MTPYFNAVATTLYSIFEGMAVTTSYLFRRPSTIQYPNKLEKPLEEQLSDRYRGILQVDTSVCIGCRICEKTCPIDCIAINLEKNKETKERFLTRFDIDISKCMFCGLCSENCSTCAIYHTKFFNGATQNVDELVVRFVDSPIVLYKHRKDSDPKTREKDLSGVIVKQKMVKQRMKKQKTAKQEMPVNKISKHKIKEEIL
ncbi:MAG: 4Fe-4S dicluster domain-containing protein [Desulfobacula sp.]|nr:4Fe-4S dicluster domain-containing protein [Desulfobacula sp.]